MKYETRQIRLVGELQRETAITAIRNLPINQDKPLVITIGEEVKRRKTEQNAFAWASMLKDFYLQGWVNGKQYSQEAWHEYLKTQYLPDHFIEGITLKDYVKWVDSPDGQRKMIGSTTKLSIKGFSEYLERCFAFGAELGIQFTIREYE